MLSDMQCVERYYKLNGDGIFLNRVVINLSLIILLYLYI